jgi:hypothetical protein
VRAGATLPPDILDGVYSQSSVYSGGDITNAKMTDEGISGSTVGSWAATNNAANSWLACSHSASTIIGVKVQGGSPSGWGPISPYLNGVLIQTFDGTTWTTRATISGVTDSGAVFPFSFSPVSGATGTRLFITAANWLATALLIPQRA